MTAYSYVHIYAIYEYVGKSIQWLWPKKSGDLHQEVLH